MKYIRKISLLTLVFVIVLSSFTFAADTPSPWAEGSIHELMTLGILDNSIFDGYAELTTRLDFAYLGVKLYEFYTGKVAETGFEKFNDTDNEWVLKAKSLGIVSGYNDGTFRPHQLIKRDELAALFVNVFRSAGIQYKMYTGELFNDDAQIASWAKEAVYIAKANGIISGVGENRFDAKSNATKQQALLMFNNGIEVKSDTVTSGNIVNNVSYDFINGCVTHAIELTDYIGRDIRAVYEELIPLYGEDVKLMEFFGGGYVSIVGKFGQVAAMRCSTNNLVEEVWICFNSYSKKPIDVSMRLEMVNGYTVNQGINNLMKAMELETTDLTTSRNIQGAFNVIGYDRIEETQSLGVEFTTDLTKIFGLKLFRNQ